MGSFCKHCGKELNGDEPYCPECGMPTGAAYTQISPAAAPRDNSVKIAVVVIAVIAVICIIGIAMLPSLVNTNTEKYTVTLRVDSFRIDVADAEHQYNGPHTRGEAILYVACSDGSNTATKELHLDKNYEINTPGTNIFENEFAVEVTGDLKDLKFTVFLYYTVEDEYYAISDIIDIYSVMPTPADVKYIGDTGIAFDMNDLTDGKVTLKGDSDPIGEVNLTVTTVKH